MICLLKISSCPSKFLVRSRTRSTCKLIFIFAFLLLVTSFTSVFCLSSQVLVPFFLPVITSFSSAFFLIGIVNLLLPITRVNVNVPWTVHHKTLSLSGRIFIGGTNNATTKNISRLHVFHVHVPSIRATATDRTNWPGTVSFPCHVPYCCWSRALFLSWKRCLAAVMVSSVFLLEIFGVSSVDPGGIKRTFWNA